MNKKIVTFVVVISSVLLSACGPKSSEQNIDLNTTPTSDIAMVSPEPSSSITASPSANTSEPMVALKTKNGQIVIKLYQQDAPNTVSTFLNKVNSGFYNGLTFHRVIPGFVAQGGDPTGSGTGGGRQKSELNNRPFVRGSVGLARTPDTKEYSNDSQFYICFTTDGCQSLTGDYVNFGEVVSGLDILDKIQQGDKILEITTKTK